MLLMHHIAQHSSLEYVCTAAVRGPASADPSRSSFLNPRTLFSLIPSTIAATSASGNPDSECQPLSKHKQPAVEQAHRSR